MFPISKTWSRMCCIVYTISPLCFIWPKHFLSWWTKMTNINRIVPLKRVKPSVKTFTEKKMEVVFRGNQFDFHCEINIISTFWSLKSNCIPCKHWNVNFENYKIEQVENCRTIRTRNEAGSFEGNWGYIFLLTWRIGFAVERAHPCYYC